MKTVTNEIINVKLTEKILDRLFKGKYFMSAVIAWMHPKLPSYIPVSWLQINYVTYNTKSLSVMIHVRVVDTVEEKSKIPDDAVIFKWDIGVLINTYLGLDSERWIIIRE